VKKYKIISAWNKNINLEVAWKKRQDIVWHLERKKLQKRQIGKRTAASEVWSRSPNARNAAVWFPENAPNEEVN
jgi:hypothetical protein